MQRLTLKENYLSIFSLSGNQSLKSINETSALEEGSMHKVKNLINRHAMKDRETGLECKPNSH